MKHTRKTLTALCLSLMTSVVAAEDWSQFPTLPGNPTWVDTGPMLGLVEVSHDPYVWVEDMGRFVYAPPGTMSETGLWVNIPFAEAANGDRPMLNMSVVDRSRVTDDGLFFADNFQFGRQISAHGNAVTVYEDYIFVTWYHGGMDNRHVMLSRRHFDSDTWETIQFPHRHIGFQGNPTIGDSHNTIAVGVCPIDETVHLLYDMHSYTSTNQPGNFFNYNISVPGAATAENWSLDLFNEKQNYLRRDGNYENVTYPSFSVLPDGSLMARWRVGGSTRGSFVYATYDGQGWSNNRTMTFGGANPIWGLYGSYGYRAETGGWHIGFSIRSNDSGAPLNSGFYYAFTDDPTGMTGWRTLDGQSVSIPIVDYRPLKIGEPTEFGVGDRIPVAAGWTVTENGSIHFRSTVSGTNVHYFRGPDDDEFTAVTSGVPNGGLASFGDYVLARGLEDGRFRVYATPAGEDDWELVFSDDDSPVSYRHGVLAQSGDYIVFYGQHSGMSDSLPLDVIRFRLTAE